MDVDMDMDVYGYVDMVDMVVAWPTLVRLGPPPPCGRLSLLFFLLAPAAGRRGGGGRRACRSWDGRTDESAVYLLWNPNPNRNLTLTNPNEP